MSARKKKLGVWASSAILAILATTVSANANCSKVKGDWLFYNMRLNYQDGSSVNACTISVDNTGAFTGSCAGYPLGGPQPVANPAYGNLVVDALCNLNGSDFHVPAIPSDFTITMGHMNGDIATGITANPDPVTGLTRIERLFTLIRQ